MSAIKNSVILAIFLTFTANIVGVFQVLVTEYFDIKGSKLLSIGYMNTLIFGGVILVNGYVLVYGKTGVFIQFMSLFFSNFNTEWFEGFPAVLFVMTFACTSGHMLFLRNAVKSLDYSVVEASQNLGSSQMDTLFKVVLPMLKPTIFTLVVQTFAAGLGAFAAPLIIGGDFQTISPLILNFANRPASRDLAAILSLLLGFSQVAMLAIITFNERRGHYMSIAKTQTRIKKQKITSKPLNIITHIAAYALFVINVLPFIMVILFSFMDTVAIGTKQFSLSSFTSEHYASILTNANNYLPMLRSALFSAAAGLAAVVFMTLVARMVIKNKENFFIQQIEFGFYIPMLLPSIILALGLIVSYSVPNILLGNQVIVGQTWIIPVAYMIMLLPSNLRYMKSAYYSFDENLEDASRILGGSGTRTFFQIILPALLPTVLALFAINFNGNLAEYNMSAFLYQPGRPTLGIVIRSNTDPTASIDAQAINLVYSVIVMAINGLVMYLVYGRGSQLSSRKSGIE